MPRGLNYPCTRFALHAGVDARPWSGLDVMLVGASTITMPDYGDHVYPDTLSFLNGRSYYEALHSATFTFDIDDDDKVTIFHPTTVFTVFAGASNPDFGFTLDQVAVADGAGFRATADADWARGIINGEDRDIAPVGIQLSVGLHVTAPAVDIPTLLRLYGVAYVDTPDEQDKTLQRTLEQVFGDIQVGLTEEGHVILWSVSSTSWSTTWLDTTFRDRLGFSGTEVPSSYSPDNTTDTIYQLVAEYPMPGVWHPTRPADLIAPETEIFAANISLTDGRMASNFTAAHQRWRVESLLDGPMDTKDDHLHWHRRCLPYLHPGAPCALYQDWGDSRLYRWRGDYGIEYTVEALGGPAADPSYRGRIQGYMFSGTDRQDRTWPLNLKRRSPMQTLKVQEYRFDGQWEDD